MLNIRPSNLTKEYILSKITDKDIFEKYLQINLTDYIDGGLFTNPLRPDDNPTCSIKSFNNKLIFRDWADSESLDCFSFIQRIANCNYYDGLCLIAKHFDLLEGDDVEKFKYIIDVNQIVELKKREKLKSELLIKRCDWSKKHIDFWKQFGLTIDDLEGDIHPIKCFWLNGHKYFPKNDLGFAYHFGGYDYKIYNPLANRKTGEIKFIHNVSDIFQGEQQLKFDKLNLLITSSYKDVKLLRKIEKEYNLDFEVVAPISETSLPANKIQYYIGMYANTYMYHNNDNAGIKAMVKYSQQYNMGYFHNPLELPKDPTDIVKKFGYEKGSEIIVNIIENNTLKF